MKKHIMSLLFIIFLVSCSKDGTAYFKNDHANDLSEQLSFEIGNEQINTKNIREHTSAKLITSSSLWIRIDNIDNCLSKLNEIMEMYGVYAASININENHRNYRLRVPASNYKIVLEELLGVGKIIGFTETTEDVTLQYFDMESRLKTKKELIATFHNYLNKADSMDDILSIERRIAELQSEIDDVGRQFRLLADLIDYSTIYLDLMGPVSTVDYEKTTVLDRITRLMSGFKDYISIIITVLLGVAVYGIPSVIILILLYWLLFGRIGVLRKIFKLASRKKTLKI